MVIVTSDKCKLYCEITFDESDNIERINGYYQIEEYKRNINYDKTTQKISDIYNFNKCLSKSKNSSDKKTEGYEIKTYINCLCNMCGSTFYDTTKYT